MPLSTLGIRIRATVQGLPGVLLAGAAAGLLLITAACGGGGTVQPALPGTPSSTPPAPQPSTPAATLTVNAPATATAGQPYYTAWVPAQSGATYVWTIDNGAILPPGNAATIRFTAGSLGRPVSLTCTVTNAGVVAQGGAAVQLHAGPVITTPPVSVLRHGVDAASTPARPGTVYRWTLTGGQILAGQGTSRIIFINIPAPAGALPTARIAADSTPSQLSIELDATDPVTGLTGTTNLDIPEVQDDTDPPAGLEYPGGPVVANVGQPITPILPDSAGGSIAGFNPDPSGPSLPAGLILDHDTGILYGTPAAVTPTTTYTIIAEGNDPSLGTVQATVTLTVNPALPTVTASADTLDPIPFI